MNRDDWNYSKNHSEIAHICGNYKLCGKYSMLPDIGDFHNKGISEVISKVMCCDVVADGNAAKGGTT